MAYRANIKPSPQRRPNGPKGSASKPTVKVIADIEKDRVQRRKEADRVRKQRVEENKRNERMGRPGDVDFQRMINQYRKEKTPFQQDHVAPGETNINICVRKRPVNTKERQKKDHDAITCLNPVTIVHDCKLKVDGITKYLDNNEFVFDHTFGEASTNEEIYKYTAQPLVQFVFRKRGRATVFAYGQTGSGKTYTMKGIQHQAAMDIFEEIEKVNQNDVKYVVSVSFFEIYGGRCQDLLHNRYKLTVREDGRGEVQIVGLEEIVVGSVKELKQLIEKGNRLRTTHATEVNDVSSRSHGICQIMIRDVSTSKLHGKLSLIDLAGSERGADTKNHNRQRRMESAEINKSLLALKECIRAIDSQTTHVPFRASKLTLVLKDSFVNDNARTAMIATVSPCSSSSDHTLNTLRYADRVKQKPAVLNKGGFLPPRPAKEEPVPGAPMKPLQRELQMDDSPGEVLMPPPPPAVAVKAAEVTEDIKKALEPSSSQDDIKYLHNSLRKQSKERLLNEEDDVEGLELLHETVQSLYEEEEDILNFHFQTIQENANLLTTEGALLQSIQGDEVVDYDIDLYAKQLEEILDKKSKLIDALRQKLSSFRKRLQDEETQSQRVCKLPLY